MVAPASAAQRNAPTPVTDVQSDVKTDAATNPYGTPSQIERVIVWGFRLRPSLLDLRRDATYQGYRELVAKDACITEICGFVVVLDGDKWRSSNVIVASEDELQRLHRNMEREGSSLVLVHPAGTRREVPNIEVKTFAPAPAPTPKRKPRPPRSRN